MCLSLLSFRRFLFLTLSPSICIFPFFYPFFLIFIRPLTLSLFLSFSLFPFLFLSLILQITPSISLCEPLPSVSYCLYPLGVLYLVIKFVGFSYFFPVLFLSFSLSLPVSLSVSTLCLSLLKDYLFGLYSLQVPLPISFYLSFPFSPSLFASLSFSLPSPLCPSLYHSSKTVRGL